MAWTYFWESDLNWQQHIESLAKGEEATFRPKGNSMKPKIESGQKITVSPDISDLNVGDIVFCKVNGNHYIHLIKSIDSDRFLIGNNRGGINGWTRKIFGKVTKVED